MYQCMYIYKCISFHLFVAAELICDKVGERAYSSVIYEIKVKN